MLTVTDSTIVSRPSAQIYAFLVDLRNIPKWQSEVVTSNILTSGPTRKGTRFTEDVKMGPMRTKAQCEITDLLPDRMMAFSASSPSLDYQGKVTIEPVPEGARLTITAEARPKGLWRLLQPLMGGEMRRGIRNELAQIKSVVEQRVNLED